MPRQMAALPFSGRDRTAIAFGFLTEFDLLSRRPQAITVVMASLTPPVCEPLSPLQEHPSFSLCAGS